MEKLEFEWNPEKAAKNLRVHKVAFDEAATVFSDPLSKTVYDPSHSLDEDRYITIGMSHRSRMLVVAYTERDNRIRIISTRELTSQERQNYEAGKFF
ncbi:MAG: BrnT family toxin [candidate division KSB1 bacterium]